MGEVGICAPFVRHLTDLPHYRGKGLGGSSGINFLCWIKPPAEDIDGQGLDVAAVRCMLTRWY